MHEQEKTAEAADEHHHQHKPGEIVLEPEMAARMGVETTAARAADFSEVLAVSGQVMAAPGDVAVVVAPTAGVVNLSSAAVPGNAVSAGSVIAGVSAKKIAGGDINLAGKAEIDAATRELERAKPLLEQGLITQKDYNEILSRLEAARAAYSPSAASGAATSPIAGSITALLVSQGEYVEAGQPIARVSRTSRLTLRADIPESHYSFLPHVATANIRPAGSDNAISLAALGGRLSSGNSIANASAGYFPVYFTFNNDGSVAPGAFAEVWLKGETRKNVLTVPLSAITEQQGEFYIYVKLDDECYERRLVTLGDSDGISTEVITGIAPGENVVVKGATVVRLAENSGSIPEGHSHNH